MRYYITISKEKILKKIMTNKIESNYHDLGVQSKFISFSQLQANRIGQSQWTMGQTTL